MVRFVELSGVFIEDTGEGDEVGAEWAIGLLQNRSADQRPTMRSGPLGGKQNLENEAGDFVTMKVGVSMPLSVAGGERRESRVVSRPDLFRQLHH